MSVDDKLRPRTGQTVKLIEGPKIGQRSLYEQQVLDEDTYTEALSHIITRDFFPNLPHLHATNAYLTALTNNDPELLSSSIRKLARLAQDKEDSQRQSGGGDARTREEERAKAARRQEFENMGTPYMNKPGASSRNGYRSNKRKGPGMGRTPVGARGWDTPNIGEARGRGRDGDGSSSSSSSSSDEAADAENEEQQVRASDASGAQSRKSKRRQKAAMPTSIDRTPIVRDDLTLDAFQRNFTSEDNASFAQIVDTENVTRREERWKWAWDAEKRANERRIEGEERRKILLDVATSGKWRVGNDGRRLIGGLGEGGRDRAQGEVWRDEKKLLLGQIIDADAAATGKALLTDSTAEGSSSALVPHSSTNSSSALITNQDALSSQSKTSFALNEQPIPLNHPLGRALAEAGLPPTALISQEDGALVPLRDLSNGSGDGRGRGQDEKAERLEAEREVMGDEQVEHLPYAGSGGDQWQYKTRNNFYFPADANTKPYPASRNPSLLPESKREAAPAISHLNTRLRDDEDAGPAVPGSFRRATAQSETGRGSSPARSWVEAAVKGTPYHPFSGAATAGDEDEDESNGLPKINNYSLLPTNPSPIPEKLPSLLTWGTLLSTPRALDHDSSDDPLDLNNGGGGGGGGRSFRLPEMRRRDEIGRKLGDKASRDMNERARHYTPRSNGTSLADSIRRIADKGKSLRRSDQHTPGASTGFGQMLPPSSTLTSTPRRSDHLTPAGKRLLDRSLGRSPMTNSGSTKGGGSVSSVNRGAAMELGSGWGASAAGRTKRKVGEMNWTPSPAHQR